MKKALALIASVIVFVSCLNFTSFADNKVKLYIPDVEVNAGDNFTADIMISDNSDLSGAVIDVCYDSAKLKYVEGTVGGIVDDNAQVALRDMKSSVRFTFLDASESVSSAGILFSLEFIALDDAAGETKLELRIDNPGDFINSDSQKLSYTMSPGTISIKNNSLPVADDSASETKTGEETTTEETTAEYENGKVQDNTTEALSSGTEKEKERTNDFNDNKKIIITIVAACIIFLLAGLLINEVYKGKRDNKKKKSKKSKKKGKR